MRIWKLILTVTALETFNANAAVINTFNGINYEWLEISEMQSLSRNQVEAMLIDGASSLFGYQYASRALVEDLFLSFASWDGVDRLHSDATVVNRVEKLLSDFGTIYYSGGDVFRGGLDEYGQYVTLDSWGQFGAYYGQPEECRFPLETCFTLVDVSYSSESGFAYAFQHSVSG